MPLDIAYSVCPHDCPSACALEVERIEGTRIGRVRGAEGQSYTRGVVCAKVARYAERQHHPDRLSVPLRRVGDKGVGRAAFRPIIVGRRRSTRSPSGSPAPRSAMAARRCGPITTPARWAWCSATASTGCAMRCVIRARMLTICNFLTDAGWLAGVGAKRGVDAREIAESPT